MAGLGYRDSVAVSVIGKVKTWAQMIAVALLLLATPEREWLITVGFCAIYVAALLTLWSMLLYLKQAWPQLSAEADK